jgi:hypothetical protein
MTRNTAHGYLGTATTGDPSMPTATTPLPAAKDKIAFTIKEAVRASGLSRSMLYVAIGDGALRARKCGARTVILETDLRRFLRSLPQLAKSEKRLSAA